MFIFVEKIAIHIQNKINILLYTMFQNWFIIVRLLLLDIKYIQYTFMTMYAYMFVRTLQKNKGHNLNSFFI